MRRKAIQANGSLSIVVFGNSYANAGFHAVVNAFIENIKEIRLVSNAACQPFVNSTEYAVGDYRRQCPPFIKHSIDYIEDLKPDLIFFLFRQVVFCIIHIFFIQPIYGVARPIDNIETDEQMINMQKTIDRLSLVTKVILIQMPLPASNKGYTDLLLKILEKKQSFDGLYMDFTAFRATYHFANKRLEHLECDKCVKIYGHHIFCDSKICRVFDPDNLLTFYDWATHFNPYAQICLSRLYRDTLLEVLVDQRFDED
uniref:SGNH domain-containing protein n=1 Tax=Syphacia muris TaxID=451379 RepID=A0A0N5ACD6_9BILA